MKEFIITCLVAFSFCILASGGSKQKINNHLFSEFIQKLENNYLLRLRSEKKSKNRLKIEKEMNVIKLAKKSKTIWNSLSLKDQENIKINFKEKMNKKKSEFTKPGKEIAKLFDIGIVEKQEVYSVNLLVGLMRNVQKKNIYDQSLVSQLKFREHNFFKNNEEALMKFEFFLQSNLTNKDQQEVIDTFKKSTRNKDRTELQDRLIHLFQEK